MLGSSERILDDPDSGSNRADVWLGTAMVNKVCQFIQPGSKLNTAWPGPDAVDVTMTLRVFDV
jgi:hypothetical protein